MKFQLKYMCEVLGVGVRELNDILQAAYLEVADFGHRRFLDSEDPELSEGTVERLFALQEMLEYAESVFGDKKKAAHWFHEINYALGVVEPLHLMRVPGVTGIDNIRQVLNLLGQIKHDIYS